MSTPLPQDVSDLPAHVARPLSKAERAALPDLAWTEHDPPYLPKEYKVVFTHGHLTAPECGGEWSVSSERKNHHVDIHFCKQMPERIEDLQRLLEEQKAHEEGSVEWFMGINQRHRQELGRAGNQHWAKVAIEALRRKEPGDDLDALAVAAGFEYRYTIESAERSPVRFYHKDLAGGYFLELTFGPTSASLGYEKDGSGIMDVVVSFYTHSQAQEGGWIPRLWPDVVPDLAHSIALSVLEVSRVFEQEWAPKPRPKKTPKA